MRGPGAVSVEFINRCSVPRKLQVGHKVKFDKRKDVDVTGARCEMGRILKFCETQKGFEFGT